MASIRVVQAVQSRNERRRTPRILSAEQDGSTELRLTFDRDMDTTKDDCVTRSCDETNGIREWTGGTWDNDRVFVQTSSTEVSASFTGDPRVIYMDGSIRARGRFRVPRRERCDAVIVSSGSSEIDGGAPSDSFSSEIDGGAPSDSFSSEVDGGSP